MPSSSLIIPFALLFSLACLTACESPDVPENTPPHFGQPEPATVEEVDERDGATDGTLMLGDTTYEFTVRACDFSGETDDMYQTVAGRGTTPAGEPFDVYVSRNEVGGMLMHTVSFQTGDVRSGEGTVFEAQRMRSGGTWASIYGSVTEPLIQIEGNRLTASGTFANDATGETMQGRIEATCDR